MFNIDWALGGEKKLKGRDCFEKLVMVGLLETNNLFLQA